MGILIVGGFTKIPNGSMTLNMGIHSTFDHGAVDEVNAAFVAENGKLHAPHNNVKRKHEDSPVD